MDAAAAAAAPPVAPPQIHPEVSRNAEGSEHHGLGHGEILASEPANSAQTDPPNDQNGQQRDPGRGAENGAPADMAAQQKNQSSTENANADAVVGILRELTTSVGINAELQCTLCHDLLCKPVTTPCGHSFCRVCLVEYLLSKELDETQCPICRGLVLHASVDEGSDTGDIPAPAFCINVTLWNLIQLLVPAMRDKDPTDEDADYTLKYDQFDAKWRIAALYQSGPNGNRRRRDLRDNDEIDSSDDDMEGAHDGEDLGSDADDDGTGPATQRRRQRYPELRQENTVDGHLEVFRNVVLDRDDANEDGYEAMRVGLAVMEFPSLFQPFNEHQECSIAVLKCEEDEDMDAGIPFFTSDDGDDDALIITDYYNEIRLRVTDDVGNIVMERTRGATQGTATFPNLRLDVPSGMYDFQFKDDLYGVRLTIRTEVRDLRDDDASSEIGSGGRPFILDQAGERTRSRRRRRRGDDDEEEDEDDASESGSDDSFIVNDDEDLEQDHVGEFSGDDEGGGTWSNPDDDDEEAAMERNERARQQQRRRRRWDQEDQSSLSSQLELDNDRRVGAEADDIDVESSPADHSDDDVDDEGQLSSVSSGRSAKRNHIVDDDSDCEHSGSENKAETSVWAPSVEPDTTRIADPQTGRKRTRAIMESEDEHASDGDEESKSNGADNETSSPSAAQPMQGFSGNKRLRHIASLFQDDDDDDDDGHADDGVHGDSRQSLFREEDTGDEDDSAISRSRWIGSDPYSTRHQQDHVNGTEDDDAGGHIADEATHESDAVDDNEESSDQSQLEDEDASWNASYEVEHDEKEEDRYSE